MRVQRGKKKRLSQHSSLAWVFFAVILHYFCNQKKLIKIAFYLKNSKNWASSFLLSAQPRENEIILKWRSGRRCMCWRMCLPRHCSEWQCVHAQEELGGDGAPRAWASPPWEPEVWMLHLQAAGGAKKQPAPPLRLIAEQQGPCAPRRRVPLGTRHALRGRGAELCPLLGSEGSAVKTLPALQGTQAPSRSWEGPPEKGMATHSSVLAWRIPRRRGARWASPWGRKLQQDWATNTFPFTFISKPVRI